MSLSHISLVSGGCPPLPMLVVVLPSLLHLAQRLHARGAAASAGLALPSALRQHGGMSTTPVPLDLIRLVEAFVFASAEPVTPSLLAPLLPPDRNPYDLLHAVRDHCAGRGVILVEHGGGWVFRTAPDLAEPLQSALTRHRRLPRAAMEVLVVVALHQPATRPEIEAIRGVGVGQATMDLLMETGLITAHGRRQVPGTPTLWVTTPRFLAQFGLRSLRDIPGAFLAGTIPAGRPDGRRAAAAAGDIGPIGDDQDEAEEALDDDDPTAS